MCANCNLTSTYHKIVINASDWAFLPWQSVCAEPFLGHFGKFRVQKVGQQLVESVSA